MHLKHLTKKRSIARSSLNKFRRWIKLFQKKEAKGQDVSEWYKNRNQYLSENKNCKQLVNTKPLLQKLKKGNSTDLKSTIETCTPVDLRNKLGPLRDQGKTGWCFAYTAADLLTAKLGKEVSAIGVAISTKTDSIYSFFDKLKRNSAFRSGFIDSVILLSQKNICLEKELPSSLAVIRY